MLPPSASNVAGAGVKRVAEEQRRLARCATSGRCGTCVWACPCIRAPRAWPTITSPASCGAAVHARDAPGRAVVGRSPWLPWRGLWPHCRRCGRGCPWASRICVIRQPLTFSGCRQGLSWSSGSIASASPLPVRAGHQVIEVAQRVAGPDSLDEHACEAPWGRAGRSAGKRNDARRLRETRSPGTMPAATRRGCAVERGALTSWAAWKERRRATWQRSHRRALERRKIKRSRLPCVDDCARRPTVWPSLPPRFHYQPCRPAVRGGPGDRSGLPGGRPVHRRTPQARVREDQSQSHGAGAQGWRLSPDRMLRHHQVPGRQGRFARLSQGSEGRARVNEGWNGFINIKQRTSATA